MDLAANWAPHFLGPYFPFFLANWASENWAPRCFGSNFGPNNFLGPNFPFCLANRAPANWVLAIAFPQKKSKSSGGRSAKHIGSQELKASYCHNWKTVMQALLVKIIIMRIKVADHNEEDCWSKRIYEQIKSVQLIAHRNTPRSISIVCNIIDPDPIMTRPASRRLVHLIFSIGHRHHMMERFAVATGRNPNWNMYSFSY